MAETRRQVHELQRTVAATKGAWPMSNGRLHVIWGQAGVYAWLPDLVALVPIASLDDRQLVAQRADDGVNDHIVGACNRLAEDGLVRQGSVPPVRPIVTRSQLKSQLSHQMSGLTLCVTSRCNLRCRYCVYSGNHPGRRPHGNEDMPIEVAHAAVEMLRRCSGGVDHSAISFYGGEPLLRPSFLREVVEHAERLLAGKQLSFHMTTNGTLLTKDLARFLVAQGFDILVSIDGPPEVHDRYRRGVDGRPTFRDTRRGLELLFDESPGYFRTKVGLSIVLAPPYKLDCVERFLQDPLIRQVARLTFSGLIDPNDWFLDAVGADRQEQATMLFEEIISFFRSIERDRLLPWTNLHSVGYHLTQDFLRRFVEARRDALRGPLGVSQGICVPGARKCFVDVDGMLARLRQFWVGIRG